MIYLLLFFIFHWYSSLFFQSFFHHRYAAHGQFTMSKFWEKVFHILSFIFQGSSYLSPYAYGVMHRMHHAFVDTEKDPHSPKFDGNPVRMLIKTRNFYNAINTAKKTVEEKFTTNVPSWRSFDAFAQSIWTRVVWSILYITIYVLLAKEHWWLYLLIPIHIVMGPAHGLIINWFSHTIGYRNFKMKNTSTNLFPIELLMWGEGLHNNHHKHGARANFAVKWFEFDPLYPFIVIMNWLNIIQLKPIKVKA